MIQYKTVIMNLPEGETNGKTRTSNEALMAPITEAIRKEAASGWELVTVSDVPVRMTYSPGCIGSLLGQKAQESCIYYMMLVYKKEN